MKRHRRAALAAATLLLTSIGTSVGLVRTASAAGPVRPSTAVAPVITVAGSLGSPNGNGLNSLFPNTTHTELFAGTFGGLLDVDLSSFTASEMSGLSGSPRAMAYSPDKTRIVLATNEGSAPLLEFIDPTTGAAYTDEKISLVGANMYEVGPLAVGLVGGVPYAFVQTVAASYYSAIPFLVMVNLNTKVVDRYSIAGLSLANYTPYSLALSADGSELYLGLGASVKVYDTANMPTVLRTITAPSDRVAVFDDDAVSATNKGVLYAAGGTTFKALDLDNSEAELFAGTLASDARSLALASDGDVAIGLRGPQMDYYDLGTDSIISTNFLSALLSTSGESNAIGITIDESPTYGRCIYTANNYDGSVTAFSVDGADCGPFASRFGALPDELGIDEDLTFTYTAPPVGGRAAQWTAIGVYVDCELVDTIEPPFSGTYSTNHADLGGGLELEFRAYTAAHLTAAGKTIDETDCRTEAAESASTKLAYETLRVDHVGAGYSNSCGADSSDTLCWGTNGDGELGDGTYDDSSRPVTTADPVTPTPGPASTPFNRTETFTETAITEIDSGEGYTCAIADGTVYCWGDNGYGQLGNGTNDSSAAPIAVSANDGFTNTNVTALSTGPETVCAVESGVAYCWGNNDDSMLGSTADSDSPLPLKVLDVASVFTNSSVTSVAVGYEHTCVVASGSVYCWGYNSDSQLGDGTSTNRSEPTLVVDNPGEGFTNSLITQVAASESSTCVIRSGSIYCWGYDSYGALGWDFNGDSSEPVKVLDNADSGFTNSGVTWITGGGGHFCAIASSKAYCWGEGGDGQLGDGEESDSGKPIAPADVTDGYTNANVTDIDAGEAHTCAIADGKAYCWGDNGDGQLGNGTNDDSDTPAPVIGGGGGGGGGGGSSTVSITSPNPSGGSVSINGTPCALPCSRSVTNGTVTLTATPAPGYRFAGWTGSACSGTGPCVVTLSEALSVGAVFELIGVIPETGNSGTLPITATLLVTLGALAVFGSRRRRLA